MSLDLKKPPSTIYSYYSLSAESTPVYVGKRSCRGALKIRKFCYKLSQYAAFPCLFSQGA